MFNVDVHMHTPNRPLGMMPRRVLCGAKTISRNLHSKENGIPYMTESNNAELTCDVFLDAH